MGFYHNFKVEIRRLDSFDRFFSKKEAAEETGLTPRTIHYYTDEGLVIPHMNSTGKGTTRKYSRMNLFELLLARNMADNNILIRDVRFVMDQIRGGMKALGPGKEVLIIYDDKSSKGSASFEAADEDGFVRIDMSEYSNVTIIDVSSLRIKAGKMG
jgi:DNA-binding transcriptional MerR regulator